MRQKILLATTVDWPAVARLAGAFAELGATVEAVFPRGHVLSVSRYVERAHPYSPLHPLASLGSAIAEARPDRIVPCDDRVLIRLLELATREPDHRALMSRSLGCLDSYPVLLARSNFIAAARKAGIAAPPTLAVADEEDLPVALEKTGLPCVLKTDGSWGGGGVVVVRTPAEARRAFRRLQGPPSRLRSLVRAARRRDLHFLAEAWEPHQAVVNAQAFVAGKPATGAFACRRGEVAASLHMDVVDWRGATGPASLMRRVACPAMEDAARRLARRFLLDGFIGLDFVRDGEGTPHLIEINPRATQICHLALDADLAAALLGMPPRPPVTDRPVIALFPQLLERGRALPGVFEDVPWDDPAVLRAVAGEDGPDILEFPPVFNGAAGKTPVMTPRQVYGPRTR